MPVVALGRPGETLPLLGAARIYVSHADWQAEITGHMREAGLIVMLLGEGEGLNSEIRQLTRLGCLPKTLVVVAPGLQRRVWEDFRRTLGREGVRAPDVADGPLVILIGPAETTAVYGRRHDEWHYEVAFDVAAAVVKL